MMTDSGQFGWGGETQNGLGNAQLARLIPRIAAIQERQLYKARIQLRNLASGPTSSADLSE
jgi:hypothetical protein